MLKKISISLVLLAVVVAAGAAAYQMTKRGSHTSNDTLSVTVTFYPLYDFARQVGGDKVEVVNMTPAGAEPHDFEPSAKDLIRAQESDVFIYNGGQFEPWVDGFLSDYDHEAINASSDIQLRDGNDPHFWLDPVLAQKTVTTIRDGLIKADPAHEEYYAANAEQYTRELAALDRDFAEGLKNCKLDTVISSHEAFSYLADRYGFHVASIAGIEPSIEPSVAKMAELTDLVRQQNIKYIFFESLVSPRLANTIAKETGANTLIFDPLEGLSQNDQNKGRDYISVQRDNLANLRTALECSQ